MNYAFVSNDVEPKLIHALLVISVKILVLRSAYDASLFETRQVHSGRSGTRSLELIAPLHAQNKFTST